MSARTCSASSILLAPFLTFGPSSRFTYRRSNTAGHRPDGFQLGPDLLEQRRFEDAGRQGRLVAVVLEDVPPAEDEVVEGGERHEVLDHRRARLGALAQADRPHLGERADGLGKPLADRHDAGDERGADGAQADQQDAEFPLSRGDLTGCFTVENYIMRPRPRRL